MDHLKASDEKDQNKSRQPSVEEQNNWFSFNDPLNVLNHTMSTANPFYNYHSEKSLQHEEHKYLTHQHLKSPALNPQPLPDSEDLRIAALHNQQHGNIPSNPGSRRASTPISPIATTKTLNNAPAKPPFELSSNSKRSIYSSSNELLSLGGVSLSGRSSKSNDSMPASMRNSASASGINKEKGHYGELSVAERMASTMGLAVTHETVARYSHGGVGGACLFNEELSEELGNVFASFRKCLELRQKYMELSFQCDGDNPKDADDYEIYPPPPKPTYPHPKATEEIVPPKTEAEDVQFEFEKCEIPGNHEINLPLKFAFKMRSDGVFMVYSTQQDMEEDKDERYVVPSIKEYYQDQEYIVNVISDGPTKSFAFRRLRYLESKFHMYVLLNEYQEMADSKDVVIFRDNKYLTLKQVFESLNLTAYDLNIDTLDMHAHKDSFHRFDKFNLKYNPMGESRLREIFLKTDNHIAGRYLAELTKEVISDLEASKYQFVEYRISIYGRSRDEWDKLAAWVVDNKLFSHNVRWLIQIPRLYNVYKSTGAVKNFEDVVRNVFQPLFEVTKDPSTHPKLHVFLQRVVGFDSVDDESKTERRIFKKYPYPTAWDLDLNPPYSYYLYYMYANMSTLNGFRKERGFNTFVLRPHAGEAGDTDHLTSAFLTSKSISHGILLRKVPALQYLYYLDQIGIAMSPLSNNALFLAYERNPFLPFFQRGLNVSLSTDDPLQFHFTKEPLIEEYSVATQIWKLSGTDMSEIARNSCLQGGWEMNIKKHWLGDRCDYPGPAGNDIQKTNVPNIRLAYRYQTLMEERMMVLGAWIRSELAEVDASAAIAEQLTKLDVSAATTHTTDSFASPRQQQPSERESISASVLKSAGVLNRFSPVEPLLMSASQMSEDGTNLVVSSPIGKYLAKDDLNAPYLALGAPSLPLIPHTLSVLGGDFRAVGNIPLLPIKSKLRGPAPPGKSECFNIYTRFLNLFNSLIVNFPKTSATEFQLKSHPTNPRNQTTAPDSSEDIIEESIALFRANAFFRNFEIKGGGDRILIYLTLYISECLVKLAKSSNVGQAEAVRILSTHAVGNFAVPGDAGFPLNSLFEKPATRNDLELMRQYLGQLRQEIAIRLPAKIYDGDKPSKWWLCFAKRKFMNIGNISGVGYV
ncbi:AMP deaminase [Nowakowskiella sp. JEL0407]|nr:AMP deaminase [Nowakowskiella sp. JEL0407]